MPKMKQESLSARGSSISVCVTCSAYRRADLNSIKLLIKDLCLSKDAGQVLTGSPLKGSETALKCENMKIGQPVKELACASAEMCIYLKDPA